MEVRHSFSQLPIKRRVDGQRLWCVFLLVLCQNVRCSYLRAQLELRVWFVVMMKQVEKALPGVRFEPGSPAFILLCEFDVKSIRIQRNRIRLAQHFRLDLGFDLAQFARRKRFLAMFLLRRGR